MIAKNRAVVYDFDGTIFNSPSRDMGENVAEKMGFKLPYKGWWGRLESLMPPFVPEHPDESWLMPEVYEAYQNDEKNENTELILLTGRPIKLKQRVTQICDSFNLFFHRYYFRGMKGQTGFDTLEIKSNIISQDIISKELTILEIWEDRHEHVHAFCEYALFWKQMYPNLEKIIIHDVLGIKYYI